MKKTTKKNTGKKSDEKAILNEIKKNPEILKAHKCCCNCNRLITKKQEENEDFYMLIEEFSEPVYFCGYFCFMEFCIGRLRIEIGQDDVYGSTKEEYDFGQLGDILLDYISILLRYRNYNGNKEYMEKLKERLILNSE